jgi:hypothetical protein
VYNSNYQSITHSKIEKEGITVNNHIYICFSFFPVHIRKTKQKKAKKIIKDETGDVNLKQEQNFKFLNLLFKTIDFCTGLASALAESLKSLYIGFALHFVSSAGGC